MPAPTSTPLDLLFYAPLTFLLATLVVLGMLIRRKNQVSQRLELYQTLVEKLSDAVVLVDADGRLLRHNAAAARLFAEESSLLTGSPLATWLPQLGPEKQQRSWLKLSDGTATPVVITRLAAEGYRAAGEQSIVLIQACPEHAKASDDAERFKRSQYFAKIGTWDWRIDSEELYWSEAIYGMFGYTVGEVTPTYERFCASVHPEDKVRVRAGELRCIETGQNHDEEYRVVWADGTIRWLRETGNVIKDEHGQAVRMMGIVRDISEEKAWASQLHQLAHHDPLTGLPNRLVFEDRLTVAIERARRDCTRVLLVFVDLNHFKSVNDLHGHAAGDKLLCATGRRLQDVLRESDTVARIGGDEFVVILEGLSMDSCLPEEAQTLAHKLLGALSPPIRIDRTQLHIGASLGIAAFPDHAATMDKLIHIADLAMYEAKRSGNNCYRLGNDHSSTSLA